MFEEAEMHDVIVIGAGFAGCSAAREVRRAGLEPLVLEARDRIGGRTLTEDWDGQRFELGANFFHWFQPYVWTEIVAAGVTPVSMPEADRAYWTVNGESQSGSYEEREAINTRAWNAYNEPSREILPRPHEPLAFPAQIAPYDQQTIRERMDSLGLSDEEYDVFSAEAEGACSGSIDDVGAISILRWHALSGHTLAGMQEAGGGIYVEEGTIAFLQPIIDAAACEVRLSTPIASITQHADHVVVTTRAGEEITGKSVVVTVPLNVLHDIAFEPPLSDVKQGGIALGHGGVGSKMMLRVKGPNLRVNGMGPNHPFGYVATIFQYDDGEQMIVTFGREGALCRPDDLAWVQAELDKLVPGFEVLGVRMHDWQADEFSQGTWSMHRPGWYTTYHAEMQRPEGRLVLANSDLADGWAGFVDGAIESGMRGGRIAAGMVH